MPLVSSQDYGRDESSAKVTLSAVFREFGTAVYFLIVKNNETRVSRLAEIFYTKTRFYKNLRL